MSILYKYLINLKVIDSFNAYRSTNPDGTNGAINYIKSFILHLIKQIGKINKNGNKNCNKKILTIMINFFNSSMVNDYESKNITIFLRSSWIYCSKMQLGTLISPNYGCIWQRCSY